MHFGQYHIIGVVLLRHLLYMPHRWFKTRLWLKSTLKHGFKGEGFKARPEELTIIEEDNIYVCRELKCSIAPNAT